MKFILFFWLFAFSFKLSAETRIAILDFELRDMTLAPSIPKEIKRTASIKPLLENELKSAKYRIIHIPLSDQHAANLGVGYLFDHPDSAARLGKSHGADYLLVGRLHKPSFLFVYLMGNLLNANTGQWIGKFIIESKGSEMKLTQKAVEGLAVKIDNLLDRSYNPPLPAKFAPIK